MRKHDLKCVFLCQLLPLSTTTAVTLLIEIVRTMGHIMVQCAPDFPLPNSKSKAVVTQDLFKQLHAGKNTNAVTRGTSGRRPSQLTARPIKEKTDRDIYERTSLNDVHYQGENKTNFTIQTAAKLLIPILSC